MASADAKATWCSIKSGTARNGSSLLNLASPASSALYTVPNTSQLTDGAGHPPRAALAGEILRWLEQGAYYTEAAAQSCP